MFYPMRF